MINSFQWLTEGVAMPRIDIARIESWIIRVAAAHDRIVGEITYIFCNDPVILRVNKEFLEHDYFTDIITFDTSRGKLIQGDMYISLDTVMTNSQQFNVDYDIELLRVIIHGILHLCGINDKGPGEREIMEQNENSALNLLETIS